MKSCLVLIIILVAGNSLLAQQPDTRYFELRTYYVHPGQLDVLIDRFQNHTIQVYEKLGMQNIGYWVSAKNEQNTFYYILAYPSKNAHKQSWDAFRADPEWTEFWSKSKGTIIDSMKSVFMNPSEVLPTMNTTSRFQGRIFELRTYTCLPGRLPNLNARFKNHTLKIFENHGMENIAYFASEENAGIQSKLIYLLGHQSEEASKKSWDEFRVDPAWIAARDASEKDGKIVEKVVSVFLKPVSFSKIK